MEKRRVVITGMGAVTPIGNNVETFWKNVERQLNSRNILMNYMVKDWRLQIGIKMEI